MTSKKSKPSIVAQCLNIFPLGVLTSSVEATVDEAKKSENRTKDFKVIFSFQDDCDESGKPFLRLSIVTSIRIAVRGRLATTESDTPIEAREFFYRAHHQGHFKIIGTKKDVEKIKASSYDIKDIWPYISMQFWFALDQAKGNIFKMSGMDIEIATMIPSEKEVKLLEPQQKN